MANVEDGNENEDESEYEYSTTETETFYVELDVAAVNHYPKTNPPNASRQQKAAQARRSAASGLANPKQQDVDSAAIDGEVEGGSNSLPQSVQILDLATSNPLVSYQNEMYSCRYYDTIGTSMFFTHHQDEPQHRPVLATDDYDLVATSRIKLVGQKMKVIPKVIVGAKRKRAENNGDDNGDGNISVPDSGDAIITANTTVGAIATSTNTTTADTANIPSQDVSSVDSTGAKKTATAQDAQRSFLERLAAIKKQRGETDVVPIPSSEELTTQTIQHNEDRPHHPHRHPAPTGNSTPSRNDRQQEIDSLDRRAAQGDQEALKRLQAIHNEIEEDSDGGSQDNREDDGISLTGNTAVSNGRNNAYKRRSASDKLPTSQRRGREHELSDTDAPGEVEIPT